MPRFRLVLDYGEKKLWICMSKATEGYAMSDVLKGNFKPKKPVEVEQNAEDISAQFEREALKRLGGSIAFVSKKKFLYGTGHNEEA